MPTTSFYSVSLSLILSLSIPSSLLNLPFWTSTPTSLESKIPDTSPRGAAPFAIPPRPRWPWRPNRSVESYALSHPQEGPTCQWEGALWGRCCNWGRTIGLLAVEEQLGTRGGGRVFASSLSFIFVSRLGGERRNARGNFIAEGC